MAKKKRVPENLTEEFSAHGTSNFSFLAGARAEFFIKSLV